MSEDTGHRRTTMLDYLKSTTASRLNLAKAERVFSADEPTRGLFWLESGLVRLTRHSSDGNEITLHVAKAGETFAEASLFAERYHCDAVADLPSTVIVIDKAQVLVSLSSDPCTAVDWIKHLSKQVQTLRAQIGLMRLKSAHERLLTYLRMQCAETSIVTIERPWKTIATEVGLTHEALYRALARLEREGHIVRNRGQSTVELKQDLSRQSS